MRLDLDNPLIYFGSIFIAVPFGFLVMGLLFILTAWIFKLLTVVGHTVGVW